MSNGEMVLERSGAADGRLRPRLVAILTALIALVWTIYWTVPAIAAIRSDTALGRGEVTGGLEAWHVFNLIFVVSTYGIRWLPGLVALLVVGYLVARRAQAKRAF
jgi:hypothetical protein